MPIRFWVCVGMVAALAGSALAQTVAGGVHPKNSYQVAQIYYYGYEGLDLKRVEANLPLKAGDWVTLGHGGWAREEKKIHASVLETTGQPPTGGAGVCCTKEGRVTVYVGLRGKSYRKQVWRTVPTGHAHLPRHGMRLYDEWVKAFTKAVEQGNALEDDSRGYAVNYDAATSKIEFAMRAWAVDPDSDRGPQLIDVLEHAQDARQRAAAAELLGYAQRSGEQIQALMDASDDASAEVRNNAVRALGVLASVKGGAPVKVGAPVNVNVQPLVDLLYSGTWTDRNKASMLIANLTAGRNPKMLAQLRKTAMPPLIEGAEWDAGHAGAFLAILGRIGGIPGAKLEKMIAADDSGGIIQAAQAAKE